MHITYKADPDDGGTVSNAGETLNPEIGTAKGSTASASIGYKFIGWYMNGTKISDDKIFVPVKQSDTWTDMTYIAKFEKMKFRVSFVDKNGEKLKDEDVEYGSGATAPDAPYIDGYEFAGWDKSFDNVTEDITVTAIYRELSVEQPVPETPQAEKPAQEPVKETQPELEQTNIEINGTAVIALAIGIVSAIFAVAIAIRKR